MPTLDVRKVGVIGLGRIGQCLVEGFFQASLFKKNEICFTTAHRDTAQRLEKELGIRPAKDNKELARASDVIIIAVKPQNIGGVLGELRETISKEKTVISVVTGVSTQEIEKGLGKEASVVRSMPNTPAFVQAGITAICLGQQATQKDAKTAKAIFSTLGTVVQVDERHMNAVTGLSGCGPAYVYVILESLTEGGIKVGLPRDLATKLSAQTVLGAAKMLLETGRHPAALKDEVTTPAGCTIDGLTELEEGRLRITLIKAVTKATERARELAKVQQ